MTSPALTKRVPETMPTVESLLAHAAFAILVAEGVDRLGQRKRARADRLAALLGVMLAATVWARVFHADYASLGPVDFYLVTAAALWLLVVAFPLRHPWVPAALLVVLGVVGLYRNHQGTLHLRTTAEANAVAELNAGGGLCLRHVHDVR